MWNDPVEAVLWNTAGQWHFLLTAWFTSSNDCNLILKVMRSNCFIHKVKSKDTTSPSQWDDAQISGYTDSIRFSVLVFFPSGCSVRYVTFDSNTAAACSYRHRKMECKCTWPQVSWTQQLSKSPNKQTLRFMAVHSSLMLRAWGCLTSILLISVDHQICSRGCLRQSDVELLR